MLSKLQKYILKQVTAKRGVVALTALEGSHKIIRKSIDRLIRRELVVGYGEKTRHKLYLHEIKLTAKGRQAVRELGPKQQRLL